MTYRPFPDDPIHLHFAWPLERRALTTPETRLEATRQRRALGRVLADCAGELERFAARLACLDTDRPAEAGALPVNINTLCVDISSRLSLKPGGIEATLARLAPAGEGLSARLEREIALRDALDARRWSALARDRARAAEVTAAVKDALSGSLWMCRDATIGQVAEKLRATACLARDLPHPDSRRAAA